MTPCISVDWHQCFGEKISPCSGQTEEADRVPPKRQYTSTKRHDVTSQKTNRENYHKITEWQCIYINFWILIEILVHQITPTFIDRCYQQFVPYTLIPTKNQHKSWANWRTCTAWGFWGKYMDLNVTRGSRKLCSMEEFHSVYVMAIITVIKLKMR
jgi:hypothetical protein